MFPLSAHVQINDGERHCDEQENSALVFHINVAKEHQGHKKQEAEGDNKSKEIDKPIFHMLCSFRLKRL